MNPLEFYLQELRDIRSAGAIRPDLKTIAVISRIGGGTLKPDCGDLNVTVGWGHAGKEGVTMPGKGKLEERTDGGAITYDVYLNDKAYWRNIPMPVWDYTIGGYQVIKKWLSYRECDLLGRGLTDDEVHEVTNMARRIAAIIALERELDANFKRVKESMYKWPTT